MPTVGELSKGPLKILAYGPSGTGKTALALTCGGVAQIMDLDLGVESALGITRRYPDNPYNGARRSVHHLAYPEPQPTLKATAFDRFKSDLILIANLCNDNKYPHKVLIVDSFTLLADAALRYILYNNGRLQRLPKLPSRGDVGGGVSQPEWGLMIDQVEQVVTILRGLPIHVILIAHSKPMKNDSDSFIRHEISIPTQRLPPRIPAYFDELWFIEMQAGAAGATRRMIRTDATPLYDARSRAGLVDGTDVNLGMPKIFEMLGRSLS